MRVGHIQKRVTRELSVIESFSIRNVGDLKALKFVITFFPVHRIVFEFEIKNPLPSPRLLVY